jgi:hypothetical protein
MTPTEYGTTTPLPGFAGARPGDTVRLSYPCLLSSCDRRALQVSLDGQRTRMLEFAYSGVEIEVAFI